MSLKSVELQVAIPRTQDLGRKQEQMNQRNVIQHHQSLEDQKLQADLQRLRSSEVEAKKQARLSSEDPSSQSSTEQHAQQNAQQEEEKHQNERDAEHPFKGKHIDISL